MVKVDLVKVYEELRKLMAEEYLTGEFGSVSATVVEEKLSTEEMGKVGVKNISNSKRFKTGYDRIKQQKKDIRQDYRKVVTEGKKIGKWKTGIDNWDTKKKVWGGSPAPNYVKNTAYTDLVQNEEKSHFLRKATTLRTSKEVLLVVIKSFLLQGQPV